MTWSWIFSASSRVRVKTWSAWTSSCSARPQTGVTSAWRRRQDGVAAVLDQLAPLGGQLAPVAGVVLAQRAVGGHRAPGHPAAALEVGAERTRRAGDVGAERHRQEPGAGLHDEAPVGGTADVHAGEGPVLDGRQRPGEHVDHLIGRERQIGAETADQARLVEHHDPRHTGCARLGQRHQVPRPGRRPRRSRRRRPCSARSAGVDERQPGGDGTGELELDGLGPAGDRVEELAPGGERPTRQGAVAERRSGVERRRVGDREGAVVVRPRRPGCPTAPAGSSSRADRCGGAWVRRAAPRCARSTKAMAAARSVWGRLPTDVGAPSGSVSGRPVTSLAALVGPTVSALPTRDHRSPADLPRHWNSDQRGASANLNPMSSIIRLRLWPLRVLWVVLALAGGAVAADALDGRSGPVVAVTAAAAWLGWAAASGGHARPAHLQPHGGPRAGPRRVDRRARRRRARATRAGCSTRSRSSPPPARACSPSPPG